MFESLLNAFRAPDIRRRILYVLGILIVFRFLAAVPVPGIDRTQLQAFLENNPIFGLLNLFSGGGLSQLSIVALGMALRSGGGWTTTRPNSLSARCAACSRQSSSSSSTRGTASPVSAV